MTAKETYQSLRADVSSRIEQKLKELQALTADDIIDMYKAEAEKLSVQDGKYPGTGGIRTFITGRDKFAYDFIDLDQYYIKDEADEMLEEEKKEREEADEALDERISDWEEKLDKEISDREAADQALQDNIDAEEERAKEAEEELQDNIDKETKRAEAAEQVLQDNIDKETERAEAAEADLDQKIIDEHNLSVSGDDALKVLIEALQDKLIYFDDHFVCKSNDSGGYLNWDKDAGIYIHDYNYGDAWINAAGTDSMPLCFAVTVDGITYQYCVDMKTGYAYYRYGEVGEGSLVDIPWIPVDSALLDQMNQETAERENADNRLVDWAKSHFVDVISTVGDSPLTLETSCNYDSDGYKAYTIHGTVDCYSKHEIDELVDELEQSDYQLQQGIDNVQDSVNNVQSGVDNLQASMQSQIDAITSNYITSIGCDTTSPLFLSTSKNGNTVTITGHIDLTDYYTKSGIDSLLAEIISYINDGLDSKQDVLTAGTGIDITNNVISCTLDNTVFKIVEQLPTSDINTNVIYVVIGETTGESDNLYSEYIYVNGQWEKIGESKADTNLSDYYTKGEVDDLINSIYTTLGDYQKKLNYYHENRDEESDVLFAYITVNPDTYTLSDGTSVTSPNLAQYRLQYMKSGYALNGETVWWTTDYKGEEITVLQQVVRCSNETKQPKTVFQEYPDFFEWIVDQSNGSDYSQRLVLDRNGLWLNNVKLGAGGDVDLSNYYTKQEIDEMLDEINVDLDNYQKKLELYSETSNSATIETPDIGYGTISTVWSGGNNLTMTITANIGNTVMHGDYIYVNGSGTNTASIKKDGNEVLTEADLSKDDISNLLEYYSYNNSIAESATDKNSNVHILEVNGTGNTNVFTLSGSSVPEGREMYWIIHNTGTGTYTYQFGRLTSYHHICVDGNDTLTIQPGEYGEFSMISDGTNGYIRSASQS